MVKVKELVVPTLTESPIWYDERGVRYVDDGVPYLTTHQLAKEMKMYPETLYRYCRKWFGPLPDGRAGAKLGYRIPLEYRRVTKAWLQDENPRVREVARRALVTAPRDFVVVVANVGSTHYTVAEAVGRIESLLGSSAFQGNLISMLFVGDDGDTVTN